jgi:uncharacterized membrane protein
VLIPAAVLTLVGLVWLWPGKAVNAPASSPASVTGDVVSVTQTACPAGSSVRGPCGTAAVQLTSGVHQGKEITTALPIGPGSPAVKPGDHVVLTPNGADPNGSSYDIVDHDRGSQLWLILIVFAAAVVGFGRWRGLSALGGLAVTFLMLLIFIIPSIAQGHQPLLVAIVGCSAVMLIALYLTHGPSTATSMAVLGTLASLALTGVLATLCTGALKLTGVATEETAFLTVQYHNVNMQGLLLAGIIIGALGALPDMTVTQAYTVTELAAANPNQGFLQLYQSASRVGRVHIASVINTIVLAYAGASLPLLLLLTNASGSWSSVITGQQLTEEIVRSVVGTLGLIAAAPITTALAAFAVAHRGSPTPPERPRHHDHDVYATSRQHHEGAHRDWTPPAQPRHATTDTHPYGRPASPPVWPDGR